MQPTNQRHHRRHSNQSSWLGSTSKKVFFKMDPKGKRDMESEEVRMFEEEQRKASAVTQAKQCAWTKWNDIEPNCNGTTGDIIPSSLYL